MNSAPLALTQFVDVFDREDLFEILDNNRVLELSRLSGDGFSGVSTLRRSTGIERRRILRPATTAHDLAVAVADRLQQEVGFDWGACPAVLLCHSHVDPESATKLARELAEALDIPPSRVRGFNFGCTGFIKLLCEGRRLLERVGDRRHIPLLSVEVPEDWHDASDKAFCGIVSAGATATTLWRGPGHRLLGCAAREVSITPEQRYGGRQLFTTEYCEGFDFRGRPQTREVMHMDGESVFINGVELMLGACQEAYAAAEADRAPRVLGVPHQPSGKLLKTLIAAAAKDFPDVEFLNNLPGFGNTLSSTIPTVLSRVEEVAMCNERPAPERGDVLLLPAAGICMERRADHMTQAWAALSWQD